MDEARVKQLVRDISKKNITDLAVGQVAIQYVDDELSGWLQQGYKLVNTHFLGEVVEGFKMMYILVKEV
jgi:hypothetical protein